MTGRATNITIALAAVVVVCLLPQWLAAAAAKAGPLDDAVDELRKEFATAAKNPKKPIRAACDYFAQGAPDGVAVESVLSALEQRLDADPRVSAYVRWQLMSALPRAIDPAMTNRVLAIYRQAPKPAPRFGLAEKEQQSLDGMLGAFKKTDDVLLTSRLEAAAKVGVDQNKPILAYRDEWYRRLPKTPPTFAAAFEDAYERQTLAAGAEDFSPLVIVDVQNWLVIGGAQPAQCAALAGVVAKLRDKPAPSYYASAAIRSGKLCWVKKTDSMDPRKKLTHLHQALVEAAQKPPRPVPK